LEPGGRRPVQLTVKRSFWKGARRKGGKKKKKRDVGASRHFKKKDDSLSGKGWLVVSLRGLLYTHSWRGGKASEKKKSLLPGRDRGNGPAGKGAMNARLPYRREKKQCLGSKRGKKGRGLSGEGSPMRPKETVRQEGSRGRQARKVQGRQHVLHPGRDPDGKARGSDAAWSSG